MKYFIIGFIIIIISSGLRCQETARDKHTLSDIEKAFQKGQFKLTTQWANTLLNKNKLNISTQERLKSFMDRVERIKADFTLTEPEIEVRLQKAFPAYSQADKINWEKNKWLEFRIIDDKKYYFKRAVSNLKLILAGQLAKQTSVSQLVTDKLGLFRLEHSRAVLNTGNSDGKPVLPVNMKVTYQITVNADAIPDGEIIRCWMPWPREVHQRQQYIKLLSTSPADHFIAPDSVQQRSIYLEQPARKGKPTLFEIQYTYQSMAQYFDLNNFKRAPYKTGTPSYKEYTSEQYPQIVFSKEIKHLTDSIVEGSADPRDIVKKLYYWINDHIIWTGALEYSIMPDIPGYVLMTRRGDCGMQTLLFMTMARYKGVPVKWQSGWMMHPGEVNLHDWCEVYYEGIGWVPLDISFNIQKSSNINEKEFYISGIDAYRMIINDAISTPFVPVKKFPRSEPYDFQRGEVEWSKGNLYFNQWNYSIQIEYLNSENK